MKDHQICTYLSKFVLYFQSPSIQVSGGEKLTATDFVWGLKKTQHKTNALWTSSFHFTLSLLWYFLIDPCQSLLTQFLPAQVVRAVCTLSWSEDRSSASLSLWTFVLCRHRCYAPHHGFLPGWLVFQMLRRFPFFLPKPQSFIFLFLPADFFLPWSPNLFFPSVLYILLAVPSCKL